MLPFVLVVLLLVCVVAGALLVVQLGSDDSEASSSGASRQDEPDAGETTDPEDGETDTETEPLPACPLNSSTPEVLRYWQDATGIHVVIVIHTTCATRQTLSDPQAAFGLFRGTVAYAQGRFDFEQANVAIPANGTSGEIELLFGGSADLNQEGLSSLPIPSSEGDSVSEGFELSYRFVCTPVTEGGAETGSVVADAPADLGSGGTQADDSDSFPTDIPAPARGQAATDELNRIANADAAFVQTQLFNRWVPQLSAKRVQSPPITDATRTYTDDGDILDNYRDLKALYPSLKLVRSADYSSFKLEGFWVMVLGESYLDAASANGWCDAQGFPERECYAKRISQGDWEGNTETRER